MTTLKKLSLTLFFTATALPLLGFNNPILQELNKKMEFTKNPEFSFGLAIIAGGKCITNSIPREQMGFLKNKLYKYSGRSAMLFGSAWVFNSLNLVKK